MSKRKRAPKSPAGVEPTACPFPPKLLDTPVDITQVPRGFDPLPPSSFFKLGFWGMILLVVSFSLATALPFAYALQRLPAFLYDFIMMVLPLLLMGIGFILSGLTFYGYWRQTGARLALVVSISFFISVFAVIGMLLQSIELVIDILVQPPYILNNLITLVCHVSLIITITFWAIGTFSLPREPKHRFTPIAISIFCLWAVINLMLPIPTLILWLIFPGDLPVYYTLFGLLIMGQYPWIASGTSLWMIYWVLVFILWFAAIPSAMIFYEVSPASIKENA